MFVWLGVMYLSRMKIHKKMGNPTESNIGALIVLSPPIITLMGVFGAAS